MILFTHMNYYRLTGDLLHFFILTFLPLAIWKTGSCAGVSGRTQLLLAQVHVTRYIDVFIVFISLYNTLFKIHFIIISFLTVYLIYFRFKKTHDRENDRFHSELLVVIALILAIFIRYSSEATEYWWAFSIYLESVAIVPQLYMTYKSGTSRTLVSVYVLFLALYRSSYIANWIYRYYYQGHFDFISLGSGSVQVLIYTVYPVILLINRCKSKASKPLTIYAITEPTLIITKASKDVDVQKEKLVSNTEEYKY